MLLLVVDTAGPAGGVLLAEVDASGGGDLLQRQVEIHGMIDLHPRQFSVELIPAIAELLRASGRRLADVDAFAVVSGPGSFTGLRVGLSAVKAMAEVTGKPILTLSHLAILASIAATLSDCDSGDEPMHVVMDAGRGEFYHGLYRDAGRMRVSETFEPLDGLMARIQEQPGAVVVSETAMMSALKSVAGLRLCEVASPTVQDALPLAVEEWRAGRFQDAATVDANYLRRSDAVVVARRQTEALPGAVQAEDALR